MISKESRNLFENFKTNLNEGQENHGKLLYELEADFKETLKRAINKVEYGELTIKELLYIGFNNNYIHIDGKTHCLGYVYDGEICSSDFEINDAMLNTEIAFDETDEDGDSYTIIYVNLANAEDSINLTLKNA